MIKKTFIASAAILGLALTGVPAWAEEVDCTVDPLNELCFEAYNTEAMPISEINETTVDDPADYPENNKVEITEIEEAEEIEEETEPALWPMYLSLGALGLAILVFIILNLFGRKQKK